MTVKRYRIKGLLTAKSPLRIGSWEADQKKHPRKTLPEGGDSQAVCSAISLDHRGKPCIPASSIKGALRARAQTFADCGQYVDELLGVQYEDKKLGGRLLFYDAVFDKARTSIPPLFADIGDDEPSPLHFDPDRCACLFASTTIDRKFKTAAPNRLFFHEVVPPGAAFGLEICGEGLTERQIGFLLRLLDEFDRQDDFVTLGADGVRGFGRMGWRLQSVSGLATPQAYAKWLEKSAAGFDAMDEIDEKIWRGWKREFQSLESTGKNTTLAVDLEIRFQGAFMVNDPSRVRRRNDRAENDRDDTGPDHVCLEDENGRVVLRSRSMRGALRAQAEKIARTVSDLPDDRVDRVACFIDSRDQCCPPVERLDDVADKLCIACRLFGANGWKSPVTVSDFTAAEGNDGEKFRQDFVGIDRFTGGAADQKKFDAQYRYKPVLEGRISVDLERLGPAEAGLLVLTLKDLIQGRMGLGFGRSKCFGAATARATCVRLPERLPQWAAGSVHDRLAQTGDALNESQIELANRLIERFHETIASKS